jgi:hypothetical protein
LAAKFRKPAFFTQIVRFEFVVLQNASLRKAEAQKGG